MIDLSEESAALEAALGPSLATGGGRVIQFVSAQRGEGVSTVAREFARHLSQSARRGVWLVELDLMRGDQYAALAADPERYGFLGKAARATPDGSMFFQVAPALKGVDGRPWTDDSYMAAYPVGGRRWWVTRFRREALKAGQTARILDAPDYWRALRRHADWVIVDAPAAERSRVVLATAPHVDANVLVVAAETGEAERPPMLRDAIQSVGGHCAGVFLNRTRTEPAPFMRRRNPG
ncbi:MAG TPA: sugar kinase [Caulobacteraceae bacterium]|jgi:Mrp family chromosome partitioning ATPase|nr:sugar kinase [Caulobacteraceae bacterium]